MASMAVTAAATAVAGRVFAPRASASANPGAAIRPPAARWITRRGASTVARAHAMPGLPTSGLKDLTCCVEVRVVAPDSCVRGAYGGRHPEPRAASGWSTPLDAVRRSPRVSAVVPDPAGMLAASRRVKTYASPFRARKRQQHNPTAAALTIQKQHTAPSPVGSARPVVQAQQFDRAMLEELFTIADAMSEVKPGSDESRMLSGEVLASDRTTAWAILVR